MEKVRTCWRALTYLACRRVPWGGGSDGSCGIVREREGGVAERLRVGPRVRPMGSGDGGVAG